MLRSWKLGTAFGIGIYVHWSFLALLGAMAFFSRSDGLPAVAFVLLLTVAMFGCVVLHELGHALTARCFGIQTRDITLLPIGGVARLERMSEDPWEELLIAVAGPAVNVVIAGLLALGFFGTGLLDGATFTHIRVQLNEGNLPQLFAQHPWPIVLLIALMTINILLVLFNMIPAFPMDGGRVFRALLTTLIGHRSATEVAALLGGAIAVAMVLSSFSIIALPLLGQGNPLLALVGLFVFFAGQQELYAVRYREAQRQTAHLNVSRPLPGPFIRPSVLPPEPNFSGFTWDREHHVWIEWREGQPVHACWVPSE